MKLRVAGAQIPVTEEIHANVAAIDRAIDFAVAQGADLLLTPEGSLSGYTPAFDPTAVAAALQHVTTRARDHRLALALGTCFIERDDGRCYNQIRFYESGGSFAGFHSKTLTCGTLTEPPSGEINDFAVRPLRTYTLKGIPVGGLICNDLWANPGVTPSPDPHLTQELARLGAKIIFHAVNGDRNGSEWSEVNWQFHESNLRMRAKAGNLWIVTVDNCHPTDIPCSAPSGVINPDGQWVIKTPPKGEQLFVHTMEV